MTSVKREARVLASLDTFLEGARSDLRLGRLSANAGLLRALLEHASFRELRLFCPSVAERSRLEGLLADWLPAPLRDRLSLRLQVELPEALGTGEIDLFHSAGWSRYLPGLARLRAAYAPRAFPLTGIVHSLNGPEMRERCRGFATAPFLACDALLCSSSAGREVVRRQLEASGGFAGRLEQVPLGVGEEFFRLPAKAAARQALGLGNEFVFLWLGRLSAPTKADLIPLLYAFQQVREEEREVRLLLAGGTEESSCAAFQAAIEELGLGDCAHLLRNPTDGDRAALYAACDAFVSPVDNHQETFGLSVVEAMAAGLPCLVSDWDGYKDLVDEGGSGYRIPTHWNRPAMRDTLLREVLEPDLAQLSLSQGVAVDLNVLASRMLELVREPGRARAMGERGRLRARELFHWKAVIARTETVWDELEATAQGLALPVLQPDPFEPWHVFAGYATGEIVPGQEVSLSRLGRGILAGKIPMPATWSDLGPLQDGKLLGALVQGLARDGASPFGALCSRVAGERRVPQDQVEAMVLWLLKQGILERSPTV